MDPFVASGDHEQLVHDPLEDTSYFHDPICTLICSVEEQGEGCDSVAPYDIAEAYNVLFLRIRSSAEAIGSKDLPFPALNILRRNSSLLVKAMHRDICRTLIKRPLDIYYAASVESQSHNWRETTVEAYLMAESRLLSHYALRLLAEIFRFSVISSTFPGEYKCARNIYHFVY